MRIGMVGLGKMGANMTKRLIEKGHEVVGFDLGAEARAAVASFGAETAASLDELAAKLAAPRVAWVMVPAGKPTDDTVAALGQRSQAGDVVIDGGNSNYKEAAPYAAQLSKGACTSSTPAPPAGSGGSRTATASWSAAAPRPSPSRSRSLSLSPLRAAMPMSALSAPGTL